MPALPVIAVFDVGKTNKKLLLFNEQYEMVYEQTARFAETVDEDGDACENLESLRTSLHDTLYGILQDQSYEIKAINVAAYGASLVHIDANGEPLTPLYNYLKPYPGNLQQDLYSRYGGAEAFAVATASPALGSLNSGLQLYRIMREQPHIFEKIKYALHLPQYLSYLITGQPYSDITSIGCHTALWDFEKMQYHRWVHEESLLPKLAPIHPTHKALPAVVRVMECPVGVGVHDSSAALIPYHVQATNPFLLISTGTWCITLNPFNSTPLTASELAQDCLCYLDYKGAPVKAARLFLGPQYDDGVKRLANHFCQDSTRYRNTVFDTTVLNKAMQKTAWSFEKVSLDACDLALFENGTEAYYAVMLQLMYQQYRSTKLVLNAGIRQIFVDGGFSKNEVYMHLLAAFFPEQEVYAASMAQGTALGAALAIHNSWNKNSIPAHLVHLKRYECKGELLFSSPGVARSN